MSEVKRQKNIVEEWAKNIRKIATDGCYGANSTSKEYFKKIQGYCDAILITIEVSTKDESEGNKEPKIARGNRAKKDCFIPMDSPEEVHVYCEGHEMRCWKCKKNHDE